MEDLGQVVQFWRNRRALVTGGTGMIGSWLVKELLTRQVYTVVLVRDADPQSELYRSGDIQRVSVVNGDLKDFWTLERAINEHEIDTVFHLGGQTIVGTAHRFPMETFETNVRGTYHVLEACRIHRSLVQRAVIASSDKAYGQRGDLPYTEDMALDGSYPYEVSKSCSDLISRAYFRSYTMPIAIARCGNVYGGGDLNWSRIVPGTIRSFLRGERPVIRSDGTFVRDYIYVKDVVRAYVRLAECLDDSAVVGEAFNFSTESPLTVLDLVAVIQRMMECQHLPPDLRNTVQGEIRNQHLKATKAHRVLGWKAEYTLEDGLAETIAWYSEFMGELRTSAVGGARP